jgi:peroxiredoxin
VILVAMGLSAGSADAAGEEAGDFTLRDINGEQVSLSQYRGKVVLMNFWATWCAPCMLEMPHLQTMYTELQEQGLVVLSISIDDARASSKVKPLIKKNGYTFPVLLDKETTVVSRFNPGKEVPYTMIVDREGRIVERHAGYNPGDEKELRAQVERILAGE